MRLNTKKYKEIMEQRNLTTNIICTKTGLLEQSFNWIMENGGFTEIPTLERLAEVAGVNVKDIKLSDPSGSSENVIEFTKDAQTATLSLSQKRYISRVKELAKSRPEECKVIALNKDGSLCAHIPVEWIKIGPPKKVSEKQRELSRERMKALHQKRTNTVHKNG